MIPRTLIVIDDDKQQAEALAKIIQKSVLYSDVKPIWDEEAILSTIEDRFYTLAVLDIRMDQYETDGIKIAKRIVEINPFAKILFVSAFLKEYMNDVLALMQNGNILGFSEKKEYELWKSELQELIVNYYEDLDKNPQKITSALLQSYADLKDEEDTYIKGMKFENFVTLLFRSIGFTEILKRVKDKSGNETDLIIRNDIDDVFLSKFGKYILIECKNKPDSKIDKNDFILFNTKLKNTNGLAEIGFLISTSAFTRTAYLEAIRGSEGNQKIIFIDNALLLRLIQAENMLDELKHIIDSQVKDN